MARIRVATCQFPVSGDPRRNASWVRRQMREAAARGAHVAHFPECALSGYADVDLPSYAGYDWGLLRALTEGVLELAGELRLWVVVGSAHPLGGRHKPHNCVYVVDDRGRLVDRYDKRFCTGDRRGRSGELAHYSPGDHPVLLDLRGVRCAVLVCHEFRYPELHREALRGGARLVFHSFHAAGIAPAALRRMRAQVGAGNARLNPGDTLPEITMPATMHAAAGANHLWISASNSSRRHSCWPAFLMRPDGVVTGRLRRNVAGVLVSQVDTRLRLYDSTGPWRERALAGRLHSGSLVRDPRSRDRRSL